MARSLECYRTVIKNIFLASTIKSLHVRYTDRRKAGGAG